MASGTTPQTPPRPGEPNTRLVEYEHFIDDQIRKTRTHVKAADVFGALVNLAAVVVGYLLVVALLDHWLVPGGLGFGSRLALLIGLVGITAYCLGRGVLPPLVRRINPLFAADTIERHTPGLKNSLVNFLFFRRQQTEVPSAVYEAIEEQAAMGLSHVAQKDAVDWSRVIHVLYLLLALVVLYGLYFAVSPKSPLQTAARIMRPWSDIPVPSRVSILAVDPATTSVPRGEQIEVSAEVRGIDPDEPVTLYFSTDNNQTIDRPIAMYVPPGEYRYRCLLPESVEGVQQNLTYRIEAGDAMTPVYRIDATPAPTIVVGSVHYEYPKYTGFSSQRVERVGDIKALEGTRVTIRARANQPIKSAYIDLDCDGRTDQAMQIEGRDAQVSFTLALADDARRPQYASYLLRFTDQEGHTNRRPVEYRIEVVRDLPPEIVLVAPKDDDVEVSLGGVVAIETFANDPDFALAGVELRGEVAGKLVFVEPLLDQEQQGQFAGRFRLRPSKYDLKAGEVVEYWAVARDNKTPEANLATTPRKRLRIASPEPGEPRPDQVAKDDRRQDNGGREQDGQRQQQGGQQQGGQEGQGDEGDQGSGEAGGGQGDQGSGDAGGKSDDDQEGEADGEGAAGEGAVGEGEGAAGDQREPAGGNGTSSGAKGQESGEGEGQREAVPSNGEDDGSAFERIQEHLREQDKQSEGSSSEVAGESDGKSEAGKTGAGKTGAGKTGAGKTGADQSADQQRDQGGSRGDAEGQSGGERTTGKEGEGEGKKREGETQEGKTQEGETRPGEKATGQNGQPHQGDQQDQPTAEEAEEKGGDGPAGPDHQKHQEQPPATDRSQKQGAKDSAGDAERQTKPGGAGESDEGAGSPEPQRDSQPRDKRSDGATDKPNAEQPPPTSPAHSRHESDSRGEQGGDRSGGGKEGGGQRAPQKGTGSAGENQAADQGAGQSDQAGQGEASDRAGSDAQAPEKTGRSGQDKSGQGTGSRPADQGDQSERGKPPSGAGDRRGIQDGRESPGEQRGDRAGQSGGLPTGGGTPGSGQPAAAPPRGEPGGDEANLDYTRKATDLVLERLEDQLSHDAVDPKLLDKLGWTREDMERFVRRWRAMQKAARSTDEKGSQAQRKLDNALRSLGLRPDRVDRRAGRRADQVRNLRESYRGKVPSEIAEQMKAYMRGMSKRRNHDK